MTKRQYNHTENSCNATAQRQISISKLLVGTIIKILGPEKEIEPLILEYIFSKYLFNRFRNYRVRQKDIPYLERALCELWWGYGGGGGIDR
jgi:hypothetical protein